jgi:hypothetical protein
MSQPSSRPEHLRGLRHIDPNRVIEQTILHSGLSETVAEQVDFDALDPGQCEAWLPRLREDIRSLTWLALALEARASGTPASTCGECGSRFYPSRSDARYCSGKCRMRSHRRTAASPRPAPVADAV